ncbi:MAG TPA: tetratricopeptide repeat protein [Polyangiales bacterium]|nr:tetratricopeptide repeat protein [Polyangiales bacterium]
MSFDRAKALEAAQKYLAKGQLDRAITEYERLVQADPKDSRLLLKLGDLYTRQGAARDATTTYRKVAEQYAEQGFFLKAVAVCKQILKLDPAQTDIWERLAEMYEMLSLVSDAITTYEQVADAYTRNGSLRKAVKALQKIAELDPENVAARIRYAEALSKLNKPEEAAAAFAEGAELLKKQGRIDDFLKVGERLLFHQPENDDFARSLAAAYLERENPKHALAKLQACFNRDPKNVDTLQLLARAFEQLGQTPKTISVLKEIARLHAQEERRGEQGSVLRRILALDPQDNEARRDLSEIRKLPTDASSAAIEVAEEDYDLLLEDDESNIVEEMPASGLLHTAPPPTGVGAEVARMLEEYAVFVRYGLTEKMVAQLNAILNLDPKNLDVREKLKDVLIKARRNPEAVAQLLCLAEQLVESEPERAEEFLAEAIRLDPSNEQAKRWLSRLDQQHSAGGAALLDRNEAPTKQRPRPEESFASVLPEAMPLDDADAVELVSEDGSVATTLDEDEVVFVDEDETTDLEVDEPVQAAPEPEPELEAEPEEVPEALKETLAEIDFYVKQDMVEEAQSTLSDALSSFGNHPLLMQLHEQLFGTKDGASEPPPDPRYSARSRLGTTPGFAALPSDPAPRLELGPEAEPEAGMRMPSMPPAAASIRPGPTSIMPAAASIRPSSFIPATESVRPSKKDRSFELAQKLAEEALPQPAANSSAIEVADVLAQFKQGVAKQVDSGDAATHYDLGIAYMEMGLHTEAIDEFKLCLIDPDRRCTAHTMIGLSYVAKGEMDPGIEHLKLALEDNPKPDEEIGLWFEMGNAYELLGKNLEALIWYEKVEERDSRYRDVAQRIERLGTARTPEQESDDFDQMFDNMILKE